MKERFVWWAWGALCGLLLSPIGGLWGIRVPFIVFLAAGAATFAHDVSCVFHIRRCDCPQIGYGRLFVYGLALIYPMVILIGAMPAGEYRTKYGRLDVQYLIVDCVLMYLIGVGIVALVASVLRCLISVVCPPQKMNPRTQEPQEGGETPTEVSPAINRSAGPRGER